MKIEINKIENEQRKKQHSLKFNIRKISKINKSLSKLFKRESKKQVNIRSEKGIAIQIL